MVAEAAVTAGALVLVGVVVACVVAAAEHDAQSPAADVEIVVVVAAQTSSLSQTSFGELFSLPLSTY